MPTRDDDLESLIHTLRTAGCVFAEEEAAILMREAADRDELDTLTRRRVAGEPLESIVGWVSFSGLRLAVGPGVFVPRQRSRLLARVAVARARQQRAAVLLEAFAGVAPIASSVLHALPGVETHASDIDPAALVFARQNLGDAAHIHCGDGFDAVPDALLGGVTLLVAVPPYVPSTAADLLPREAREHEQPFALFAGEDGLLHIRLLIREAPRWLAQDGSVLIEMNASQYEPSATLGRERGLRTDRHVGTDGQTVLLELRRR